MVKRSVRLEYCFLFNYSDCFIAIILIHVNIPGDFRQAASKTKKLSEQLSIFTNRQIQLGALATMFNLAGVYVVYTYLRPIFTTQLNIPASFITITFTVYGFMSLLSNRLSGTMAERSGIKKMPLVYVVQFILLILLPSVLRIPAIGLADLMLLGLTMYLINSPVQLHMLSIAESKFPQSLVLASSLNSIFANFGIALGSGVGSLIVKNLGLHYVGPGGAVFAITTLLLLIRLNKLAARE
ncbi:conserved membrane hypothetical protein [Treponema phagedenis]|uniref:Major facilitator superfamily (MFS) profile domain-containing protein n=3 Tax=Treponema phagedenis TaxID=162 RepID=A0A0B7GUW3_TREPH|nr:hypothetical protein [Treponema phagedenis]CEM62288.1 conserved membrane hypothetical protein [Treponema phagedenis]